MKAASVILVLLLQGCAATVERPTGWAPATPSRDWCRLLASSFEDLPVEQTDGFPIRLSDIFFDGKLSEFSVTHVAFEQTPDRALLVNAWVDDERLAQEERRIAARNAPCRRGKWSVKTGWDADGFMVLDGLVWTGGIVIPMALQNQFELEINEAGELVIRARRFVGGTLFFLFPFKSADQDVWLRYLPVREGRDEPVRPS